MTGRKTIRWLGSIAVLGLTVTLLGQTAQAATVIWTNGETYEWWQSGAWSTAWANSDTAEFQGTGTDTVTLTSQAASAADVYLANGASVTVNFSGTQVLTVTSGGYLGIG